MSEGMPANVALVGGLLLGGPGLLRAALSDAPLEHAVMVFLLAVLLCYAGAAVLRRVVTGYVAGNLLARARAEHDPAADKRHEHRRRSQDAA